MKTPHEILLARHQAATPKLDAIRQKAVAQLNRQGSRAQSGNINLASWCLGGLQKLWLELVLPSRLIWAGLAAVWVLIFAANLSMQDHSPTTMAKSSPSPEMIQTYRQQERLLTDMIGPDETSVAEPQKTYSPRPSSERPFEIMM